MSESCPRRVTRGSIWAPDEPCGKPVKRRGLCGVHALAADKRDARNAEWENARNRSREASELAERLTAASAIPFAAQGDRITLSIAAAQRLLTVVRP